MSSIVDEIMNTLPENTPDEKIVEVSDKLFDIALSAFGKDSEVFDEALYALHKLYEIANSLNAKIRINDHIWILEF